MQPEDLPYWLSACHHSKHCWERLGLDLVSITELIGANPEIGLEQLCAGRQL